MGSRIAIISLDTSLGNRSIHPHTNRKTGSIPPSILYHVRDHHDILSFPVVRRNTEVIRRDILIRPGIHIALLVLLMVLHKLKHLKRFGREPRLPGILVRFEQCLDLTTGIYAKVINN